MDEQERILTEDEAQPEAEAPVEARTEDEGARAHLVAMLLGAEARCAAALMGVKEARLDHVARLAGLEGIDPEDEAMRQKVAQAVRAVLGEVPELISGAGTGAAASPRRLRRDAFARGFMGE